MTSFDAIIIGAGQAGPPLAGRLTAAGQRVAVIERNRVGGTCVNTGCIPTKTMVASAAVAQAARRAAEFGVVLDGAVRVDMRAVKARKDAVSGKSFDSVTSWLAGMENCRVIHGHARFTAPGTVEVDGEVLTAPRIFLNVGGRASWPDMPGLSGVDVLTNRTIMELEELPRHLVVVGGSYIGLEFAQMFRRFGSDVTVVERGARLMAREDADVSDAMRGIVEGEGVRVITGADDIRFAPHADGVAVGARNGEPPVIGSHVLLAVGRRPNTEDLGLEQAGIATDAHGFITVDDQLRTSAAGVWAMGDCNGRGAFTHTSYNDFEIVAANLLDDDPRRVSDRITAYGVYIDPPLGRAGLTEAQARAAGHRVLVGRRPMSRVGRAVEKGDPRGFMKIIVDAETSQILGAAILGVGGDEAVQCILDAMYARAAYTVLQRSVNIHPTVSELIPTVLGDLQPAG